MALILLAAGLGLAAQTCGFQWRWAHPAPSGSPLSGIARGDGGYVAVGASGTVVVSADGTSWSQVRPFTVDTLWGAVWGNGRYLSVAGPDVTQSLLWSSPDGLSWTPVPGAHPTMGMLFFAGGRFFDSYGGLLYDSVDGVQWTPVDLGVSLTTISGVAYGAGLYVALADAGTLLTSPDGQAWTTRRTADESGLWWLVYGNGVFLVGGDGGRVLRSADGLSWPESARPSQDDLAGLYFAGGQFYCRTYEGACYSSLDGLGWVPRDMGLTWISGMAGSASETVAVGAVSLPVPIWSIAPRIVLSRDGAAWTRVDTSATTKDLYAAASGGTPPVTVAVGDGGAIIASAGGGPFAPASSPTSSDLRGAAWGAGRFVVVGSGGTILTSEEGALWTPRASGVAADLMGVRFLEGLFLATGAGGTLLTSPDGLLWTPRDSGTTAILLAASYGSGLFVVAGSDDTLLSSADAAQWTLRNRDSSGDYLWGVAYGNGLFSAVGCCGSSSFVSSDGIGWERIPGYLGADGLVFWRGQFVASTGSAGQALVSEDGRTWVGLYSGGGSFLRSITEADGRLLATGTNGAVVEADCGPAVTGLSPAHGTALGGDAVAVTGCRLDGVKGLYFGGTAATSYSVASSRQIDAVAPPGVPGTVPVSVLTDEGWSPIAVGCGFQYFPAPRLGSVSPVRVTALGGTPLTLTGVNLSLVDTVLVDGFEVPGSALSDTTVQASTTPHPPGTVDVSVRTRDGQTSTLPGALTFVEPPVIQLVKVVRTPTFQLKIFGTNFHPGCVVMVNDVPAPKTKVKSDIKVLASGATAAAPFKHKYYSVNVRVVNTDDGVSGPTFGVHRP